MQSYELFMNYEVKSLFFVTFAPHFEKKIVKHFHFIIIRVYALLSMLALSLTTYAQYDEDNYTTKAKQDDSLEMDDMMEIENMPIHIDFSDVLILVGIVLACYVFGKIWKGCTYLLIIVAAVLYYLTRC